ncbi:MAG: multidrug efflux SMR transporter [Tannerella sp.]|jgi:small multidrug resistance pump|nr:multidrug efflux SMR transporter [Tannerella sp.]
MHYLFLALAIFFEVIGSSFIKLSNGFMKLLPTLVVAVAYLTCFYFLSLALKTIPLGITYAIWGGIGIILTALISVFIFKQSIDFRAIAGIGLIVTGMFMINIFSKTAVH